MKINFEKPPAGGGARGLIQNSPESTCLRFHCRPRNRGKGDLQVAHTDAPYKKRQQLPSAAIFSAVFIVYASLTSSTN